MGKLKVIGVAFFASVAVAAGMGTANASSGWDPVGSSTFKHRDVNLGQWFTDYVYSSGGNFMACVDSTSRSHSYTLWEHDPSGSKKVATKSSSGGCLTFNDIGDYVDGDNKKAEFMLSTNNPEGGYGVLFYD